MKDRINDNIIFNGEIVNCNSINNEAHLDGTIVYDVIRIIKGVPLFYEDHYKRLQTTANQLEIILEINHDELRNLLLELISKCRILNGNIKIIISLTSNKEIRNLIGYFIKTRYPEEQDYRKGVSVLTLNTERFRPNIKLVNKELRTTTNKLIDENNVYEIILIDRDGNITEGSRSNIFLIRRNEIFTSPTNDVLPGITRSNVLNICSQLGLKISEKKLPFSEIKNLDGVFITGTSPKVLPVIRINEFEFSSESIVLHKIMKGFDEMIEDYINGHNRFLID